MKLTSTGTSRDVRGLGRLGDIAGGPLRRWTQLDAVPGASVSVVDIAAVRLGCPEVSSGTTLSGHLQHAVVGHASQQP